MNRRDLIKAIGVFLAAPDVIDVQSAKKELELKDIFLRPKRGVTFKLCKGLTSNTEALNRIVSQAMAEGKIDESKPYEIKFGAVCNDFEDDFSDGTETCVITQYYMPYPP